MYISKCAVFFIIRLTACSFCFDVTSNVYVKKLIKTIIDYADCIFFGNSDIKS